jgi:N-acetylneuraminic acid mutarotase
LLLFATFAVFAWVASIPTDAHAQPGGKDNVFFGRWLSSTIGEIAQPIEGREGYCLGFSSAEVNAVGEDRIYMTHGFTSFGDTADVRIYDIDTDTWLTGTSSPNPRAEGVGVSQGGLVYCLGGRSGSVLSLVEAYDPTTDTWMTRAPMQVPRAGLAAAVIGNRIYAIGGRNLGDGPCSGSVLSVAEVYTVATNSWDFVTPPTIPVTDATATAHGGRVYLIGGCPVNGAPSNLVQIYDPTTDTWSAGASMPTARASLASGAMGNTIYAIGGLSTGFANLGTVEAYDIDKDTWSGPLAQKPVPASEIQAVRHGRTLYVPGSGSFGIAQQIFEAFSKR